MALKKISDAEMDAAGVCAAPDVLSGTPAENKQVFDRMVRQLVAPAYNAAVDAVNEINDTEAGIKTAESKRQTAEAGRVAAEKKRVTAETARQTAETARQTAETARQNAEAAREDQEKGYVADAEAWAKGTRNGVPVGSGDPAYENNARYFKEQARAVVGGEFVSYGRAQALTPVQKEQVLQNIGVTWACNPNLLDNHDYAVNQRGITSITAGAGYYADRWRKYGNAATGTVARGDVHIVSPGTTTFGWQQRMEADRLIEGLTYTLSFLIKPISIDDLTQIRLSYGAALDTISGSIALPANTPLNAWTAFSYTFTLPESSDGFYNFRARASAVPCELEIGPAKLELGSVQTLAHQDSSGAWVLNEVPDYAEQLRRCQRYLYIQKTNTSMITNGVLTSGKTAIHFGVAVPASMRALPALLSAPSVVRVRTTAGGNVDPVVSEVSVYAQSSFDAMITLRAATETFNTDAYTNNTPVALFVEDLQLSAEL